MPFAAAILLSTLISFYVLMGLFFMWVLSAKPYAADFKAGKISGKHYLLGAGMWALVDLYLAVYLVHFIFTTIPAGA